MRLMGLGDFTWDCGLSINDMRLMGLGDFTWDSGFRSLFINTTLICLQHMGIYPKAKLALSNSKGLSASSSEPCCGMMGIIPSIPRDL